MTPTPTTFVQAALVLLGGVATAGAQDADVSELRSSTASDELVLTVVELGDIVDPSARHDGPLLDADGEPLSEDVLAGQRRARRANLLEDVRRWIEPPLEQEHTLRLTEGGALVANVPPAAAEWIAEFARLQLDRVDRAGEANGTTTLYQLDTAVYSAEPRSFDPLGIEEQTRVFPPDAPFDARALGIEVVTAPRLAVFPSQPASVSIVDEVAYVKAYRHVVVAPGNREILDPIVDVIADGIVIDARVVPLPDDRIGVVLDASVTELVRPIETEEVVIHEGAAPVEIGVPVVHRIDLVTRVRLAAGETILITGRTKHADGVVRSPFVWGEGEARREIALSVRVERIQMESRGKGPTDGERAGGVRVRERR